MIRPLRLRNFLCALAVGAVLFTAIIAARADYPIVSQRYAADPAAVEFDGRLYLYCSNDDENGTSSYVMTSLTCFSTDDLKNWTDHGVVFSAPNNTSWASLAWAPSVVSNQSKLYLYFANGDGIIARIENRAMAAKLRKLGCPVIDVLGQAGLPGVPAFDTDAEAVAFERRVLVRRTPPRCQTPAPSPQLV